MFTYFIQGHPLTPVKIGRARDVADRLRSLQTGSPITLRVLLTLDGDREAELHERFREWRFQGEWFLWCPAIQDFIRQNSAACCDAWHSVNVYCTDKERREFNEWHAKVFKALDAVTDWARGAAIKGRELPPSLDDLWGAIETVPWLER